MHTSCSCSTWDNRRCRTGVECNSRRCATRSSAGRLEISALDGRQAEPEPSIQAGRSENSLVRSAVGLPGAFDGVYFSVHGLVLDWCGTRHWMLDKSPKLNQNVQEEPGEISLSAVPEGSPARRSKAYTLQYTALI